MSLCRSFLEAHLCARAVACIRLYMCYRRAACMWTGAELLRSGEASLRLRVMSDVACACVARAHTPIYAIPPSSFVFCLEMYTSHVLM